MSIVKHPIPIQEPSALDKRGTSPTPDQKSMQCPCCGYIGESKLFENGRFDRLHELIHAHRGYGVAEESIKTIGVSEQYGIYQFLLRESDRLKNES